MVLEMSILYLNTPTLLTLAILSTAISVSGQSVSKNNPYSPSPVGREKQPQNTSELPKQLPNRIIETPVAQTITTDPKPITFIVRSASDGASDRRSVAVPASSAGSLPPTETYKIGAGDVLFI